MAQNMVAGLMENAAAYPAPPVAPLDLKNLLDQYISLADEVVAARGAAEQATAAKVAGQEALSYAMKSILRYAEVKVDHEDAPLSLLGWGGRVTRTALEAPGQPLVLKSTDQRPGLISLDWKKPVEGGKVASYKIERRERPDGQWTLVAVALETEATLNNQERGKDWEYRVIAANKAGEGTPSNTVDAVV